MLTQEELKAELHYNPDTGVFTRLKKSIHNAGSGTVSKHTGYRAVGVKGKQIYAHRLAFLYMTGVWPKHQVDHINGDRDDNRWVNLRDATPLVNQQNLTAAQTNNRTGFLGVTFAPKRRGGKKYVAQLFAEGKRRHCSYHSTPEATHAAYVTAKRELHVGNTL